MPFFVFLSCLRHFQYSQQSSIPFFLTMCQKLQPSFPCGRQQFLCFPATSNINSCSIGPRYFRHFSYESHTGSFKFHFHNSTHYHCFYCQVSVSRCFRVAKVVLAISTFVVIANSLMASLVNWLPRYLNIATCLIFFLSIYIDCTVGNLFYLGDFSAECLLDVYIKAFLFTFSNYPLKQFLQPLRCIRYQHCIICKSQVNSVVFTYTDSF